MTCSAGPWAGKLVTGDDVNGIFYSVDTNGITTPFDLGVPQPEAYAIIPTNQDYYCTLINSGTILRVPRNYFTNFVGSLLVADEFSYPHMVQWDAAQTNFTVRYVPLPSSPGVLPNPEGATFAPLMLPTIECP
jgi:hypothetical protein